MSELGAPHAPIDSELHALRHPRPDRLIQEFEWEPISEAQCADAPEPTDAELAEKGLFRLIPSLAERAGEKPWAVVDFETFKRVLEKVYPRPRMKRKRTK